MKGGTVETEEYPEGFDPDLERMAEEYDPRYKPWSVQDEALLKRYYGKVPLSELAKKLNRTTNGICSKAANLGVAGRKG